MTVSDVGAFAARSPRADPAYATPKTSIRTRHSSGRQTSSQFSLLLACLIENIRPSIEALREFVCCGLDWKELLRITEHHRVIPQVYSSLSQVDDLVPTEILEKLRNRYQANARLTLRLTRDLIRVLEHFELRGIPTLAYKGPALAQILTGDVTGRQFTDIDLLVHPSDVRRSKAALLEMGCTPHFSLTSRQEESYIQSGYEYAFDYPDAPNSLELKWRILPRFYAIDFDIAGLFERSIAIDISGHPVRTLCPEDLLLVLCVHAAKHSWAELSLLWDISRLVESQPINWDQVRDLSEGLGIQRIVAESFALARTLCNAELSDSVQESIQRIKLSPKGANKILSIIAETQQVDTESLSYFRLMLNARERWRDRALFVWRLLFTPSVGEWEAVHLPAWLFPLYHLVRAYRLGKRLSACLPGLRMRKGRLRLPVVP